MRTIHESDFTGYSNEQIFFLIEKAANSLSATVTQKRPNEIKIMTKASAWKRGKVIIVTIDSCTVRIDAFERESDLFKTALENQRTSYVPESIQHAMEEEIAAVEAYQQDLADRIRSNKLTASEKMLLRSGGHKVTYSLIAVNVVIFIAMALSGISIIDPTADKISAWGGNFAPYTFGGEPFRLLTCVFVHIGIVHLLFNMYALYSLGIYLEPLLGRWIYLISYLCTGICSSLVSVLWAGNERVSAGASGAIFGLLGIFIVLLSTKLIDKKMRQALLQSMLVFAGYNLIFGMKGGVDNAAHIGGLASGLVFGFPLYKAIANPKFSKLIAAAMIGITILVAGISVIGNKNDTLAYEEALEAFSTEDESAVSAFNKTVALNSNVNNDSLNRFNAKILEDSVLSRWKNAEAIILKAGNMKISGLNKERYHYLSDYASLRVQQINLLLSKYKNNGSWDAKRQEKLDSLNNKITTIIDDLNPSKNSIPTD